MKSMWNYFDFNYQHISSQKIENHSKLRGKKGSEVTAHTDICRILTQQQ